MKGRRRLWKEFVENFAAGGFLVMAALWVADISSPVLGGVIAAMPIRFAATWLLGGIRHGKAFAGKLARGSIIGMAGNLIFSVMLFLTIGMLGFSPGFGLGVICCLAAVMALWLIFRG